MSLQGEVVDKHSTKLEIGARGSKYFQRNTYTWSDGRKQVLNFPGWFDESTGKLHVESERLVGECIVVDQDTVEFKAGYKEGMPGGVYVYDFITMSDDKKSRCRSWQLFKDGKPWRFVNVFEQCVSNDDAYIEFDIAGQPSTTDTDQR